MNCWHCGQTIDTRERIGMREVCPGCGRSVHCCLNCEFYDPTVHNQCRETMAEPVVDKERQNLCDYFSPTRGARSGSGKIADQRARSKLEDVFKKRS
ncbi:MAG: hypothetical protein ACREQB_12005 [Candidatus Binataceae bacterium]